MDDEFRMAHSFESRGICRPLLIALVAAQFLAPSWAQRTEPSRSTPMVAVKPRIVTLSAGQVSQFSALVENSADQSVTWSLSPQVGTVDSKGL